MINSINHIKNKYSLQLMFFLLMMINLTCEKPIITRDYPFEAEVLGPNPDCGEIQIKFTKDLDKVAEKVGYSPVAGRYIARNLPEDLKIPGMIITLNFRKALDSELGYCLTFGPGLPWIYVTFSKEKENN